MHTIQQYELSQRRYIGVQDGRKKSFGGNQQWFPKEDAKIQDKIMHEYGCGVIAISDLFLYWAMTLPNGKETLAGNYIDERNLITKEKYMALIEKIRDRYAYVYGNAGTFAPQLTRAINRYAKDNGIPYRARLDMELDDLRMLKRMEEMLQANQPIILMIGHSFPIILSRFRKKGIPFYRQTRVLNPFFKKPNKPYAHYEVVRKNVFGHFVTITGILIDEYSEVASQNIMLRISSWGEEYYISYHHLRQYINGISQPYLSGIISMISR